MIEVKQLEKSFGTIRAVNKVSFCASDGMITGLLGPNGAGKSTTLRMLYTALKPDAGQALIDGFDIVEQTTAVKTNMGVLTHNAGVYERLSARENISYFGRLNGMTNKQLNFRIDELAEMLEMKEFIDRRCKGFSQGQKTKTALARALVHKPKNIILDEPTNGLDVMATRGLRQVINNLKDVGHCVLFSSHIMQEVAVLCDEIVIIAHGVVAASGTPDEIRLTTGEDNLEDAFVQAIGTDEGLV
jgi:sodium transport system ATP-binding protein